MMKLTWTNCLLALALVVGVLFLLWLTFGPKPAAAQVSQSPVTITGTGIACEEVATMKRVARLVGAGRRQAARMVLVEALHNDSCRFLAFGAETVAQIGLIWTQVRTRDGRLFWVNSSQVVSHDTK